MRIRQHVNPLQSFFFTIPVEPLVFPEGAPVEVELGSAEAHFLFERSAEAPEGFYVGVEIRRDCVAKSNAEATRRGMGGKVRSVFANMTVDLPRLFPPERVSRFFLNFPDPWFKSRQHKRRVISPALIETLHALLREGGEVHLATDIFELGLDAMAALEDRFENLRAPWSFLGQSPVAARSRRERQCQGQGDTIWRLGYRKI